MEEMEEIDLREKLLKDVLLFLIGSALIAQLVRALVL